MAVGCHVNSAPWSGHLIVKDTLAVVLLPAASVAVNVAVYLPVPRPLAGRASVFAPAAALPRAALTWRVHAFAFFGLRLGTATHRLPFLVPGVARVTTAATVAGSESANPNVARLFFLPALVSLTVGLPVNDGAVRSGVGLTLGCGT